MYLTNIGNADKQYLSILNGEALANSAEMGLFLVRVVTFLRLTCSNVDAQRRGVPCYRSDKYQVFALHQ